MNKEEIINKVEKQADALQVYFNALIAKDLTDISEIISLSQELRAVYHQILELKSFYPEVQ